MRSVVLDIKGEKAAILDDTGVVHAVVNKDYGIGQILDLSEYEIKKAEEELSKTSDKANRSKIIPFGIKHMTRYTRIAAAALALIVIGGGVTAYAAPVSTVTIEDGSDSVEYRLNLFDRVVGVDTPDNADDEFKAEVSELSDQVHGMKISEAMDFTANHMESRPADADGNLPEIKVKVEGLKKGDKSFNDTVDHKIKEISDRRKTGLTDTGEDAVLTDGTGMKDRDMADEMTEMPVSDVYDPGTVVPSESNEKPTKTDTTDGDIKDGELPGTKDNKNDNKKPENTDGSNVTNGNDPKTGNKDNTINTGAGNASSGDTVKQPDGQIDNTISVPTENTSGVPTDINNDTSGGSGVNTGTGTNGPPLGGSFDQGNTGISQPSDIAPSDGGGTSGVPSGGTDGSDGVGSSGAADTSGGRDHGGSEPHGGSGGAGPAGS